MNLILFILTIILLSVTGVERHFSNTPTGIYIILFIFLYGLLNKFGVTTFIANKIKGASHGW